MRRPNAETPDASPRGWEILLLSSGREADEKVKAMKLLLSFGLALWLVVPAALASEDESYEKLIDRLTAITGGAGTEMAAPYFKEYADGLAEYLVSQKPSLPPRAVEIISDEIALFLHEQSFINYEVKQVQYAAYKRYFSKEDIQGLIDFYQTPLGQKTLKSTPPLLDEIQAGMVDAFESVSENLIQNIAPRLNKRMRENGW